MLSIIILAGGISHWLKNIRYGFVNFVSIICIIRRKSYIVIQSLPSVKGKIHEKSDEFLKIKLYNEGHMHEPDLTNVHDRGISNC